MTYLLMGQFCLLISIVNIFMLVVHPEEKGIVIDEIDEQMSKHEEMLRKKSQAKSDLTSPLVIQESPNYESIRGASFKESKGISFKSAWKIPGVLQYSLSYFCIKFSSYGLMLWLPMYLQKVNGYTDYETAYAAVSLDVGNVLGGVLIGYLTDLTYSRRTPFAIVSILGATVLEVGLIMINSDNRFVFIVYIFCLGLLMGGAIAIISGISCADLVIYLNINRKYRAN